MRKARPGNPVDLEDRRAAALTAAALDGARMLGLTPVETAQLLGVPAGALAAMKKAERAVDGLNGEAERADALVRVVKRLTLLLGDSETAWRAWIRRDHAGIGSKPLALLLQRDGVLTVATYLERQSALGPV